MTPGMHRFCVIMLRCAHYCGQRGIPHVFNGVVWPGVIWYDHSWPHGKVRFIVKKLSPPMRSTKPAFPEPTGIPTHAVVEIDSMSGFSKDATERAEAGRQGCRCHRV
jgi:hypothetical protein